MTLRPAGPAQADCPWLVIDTDALPAVAERLRSWGWEAVVQLRRPTDNNETLAIYAARAS